MDDDASPGVPEWVVTYGDMMSLLLTFFIMLVSLSEVVANERYRAIMDAIHKYIGYNAAPKAPLGTKFPLNAVVKKLETLGSYSKNQQEFGGVRKEAPPGEQLATFHHSQGTAVVMGDPIPFDPGRATLSAGARKLVEWINSERLAGKPNKIEIVGHAYGASTAGGPIDPGLLSYLRAKAVLNELVRLGVPLERIRIQAAGDTQPLPSSRENPFQRQDRVEILMIDKFTGHYQGRRETAQLRPRDPFQERIRIAAEPAPTRR